MEKSEKLQHLYIHTLQYLLGSFIGRFKLEVIIAECQLLI